MDNFDELYPSSQNPVGAPPQPASPAAPDVGYGEDMLRGLGGGLERGAAGLAGLPGTVSGLIDKSSDWLAAKLGQDPAEIAAYRAKVNASPLNVIPTPQSIQSAVEPYTGQFYVPQTVPGQYASTLGSFAATAPLGPGSLGARAFNTIVPALTSETAGQLTKGQGAEPWARFIGGIGGGLLGAKGLTPTGPAPAPYQAAVRVLDQAGIPITAGERTGSNLVRVAESSAADMPFSSTAAQTAKQAQNDALMQAFTEKAFDPAKLTAPSSMLGPLPKGARLPAPNVMNKGVETLSDEYNRILNPNDLTSTPKLQNDLLTHESNYYGTGLASQKTADVANARNDIIDALVAGKGKMSGPAYQAQRSDLSDLAKKAYAGNDSQAGAAFKGMRSALDDAMASGLPPGDAAALALNNQRYANMKQLTPAVAAAVGDTMSPAAIAAAVRSGRAGPASQGLGNMDELARAAQQVIRPIPNSMTAARSGWQTLFNAAPWLVTAGGAGAGAASGFGPLGILGAAAIPHVVGRAIVSRPGQAYLGNTILPQSARDVITQAMTQQGAAQPSGIARNNADIAAYNAQRDQHLRDIGLAPRAPANIGTTPYDFAPIR
jgi:hypothetical protein